MNLLSVNWDLHAIWTMLPLLTKLCLVLCSFTALLTVILSFKSALQMKNPCKLARCSNRLANLGEFQVLVLYIFGACLADHLFASIRAIERSKMSLQAVGVEAFDSLAWFAFIGFLTLLFSHSVRWFTSSRLSAKLRCMDSSQIQRRP